MTLASDQAPARREMDTFGGLLGLLVFVAGIIMIIWTFTLVRGIFEGIDEQMIEVRVASQQAAAAAPADAPDAVTVAPNEGPSFAYVGAAIALQMLGLLVLGWMGALVASKGAQLAGAYRGKGE